MAKKHRGGKKAKFMGAHLGSKHKGGKKRRSKRSGKRR